MENRNPGYRCPVKGCRARFVRPNGFRTGLAFHTRTTHKGGALYVKDDLTVWDEGGEDGKYLAICERHHQCVNSDSLAWCKRLITEDFCEVCSGSLKWCVTCDADERPYGSCETHEVIDDSIKARKQAKALDEYERYISNGGR